MVFCRAAFLTTPLAWSPKKSKYPRQVPSVYEPPLVTLSFQLKLQYIQSCVQHGALHKAMVALEELAILQRSHPSLVDPCERFLVKVRRFIEPEYVLESVWGKSQLGLHIKLARDVVVASKTAESLPPGCCLLARLLEKKKQDVAETLQHLRQRNHVLSKMLRDHPRVTERGLSESDDWAFELHKSLQRISIDMAILVSMAPVVKSLERRRSLDEPKKTVAFDKRGPQIIGNADPLVDRAPLRVTQPRTMEMLLIRGSRILPVV
ncbi:Aste57867_15130 [Aphanomyces stellatus]|uniref:Aste57867_15130 protein n=1 Tax=Aphanomyces stellatus TaxID=120398 RepID=A0A485L542_9STRA|nr:hypothetical protein As57867_015074 [Aphanomyces stellatus]VFT91940.1 Aste57867_15130 [Aphanomyces stellatus]